MNAIDDVAAERKRQIEVEGFTHEHDEERLPDEGVNDISPIKVRA